jgi:hypothetical protein
VGQGPADRSEDSSWRQPAIDERFAGSVAGMERLAYVASDGEMVPVSICDRVVAFLEDEDRIDDVSLLAIAFDKDT